MRSARPAHAATTCLAPSSPSSASSAGRQARPNPTGCPRRPRCHGATTSAPAASAAATARTVAGCTQGMSPSATTQPSAAPAAATAKARLLPMPRSASGHSITSLPSRRSAAARSPSPGRTTATVRGSAARRLRQATAPTVSPAPPRGVSSFAPPKRVARPAASSTPTITREAAGTCRPSPSPAPGRARPSRCGWSGSC